MKPPAELHSWLTLVFLNTAKPARRICRNGLLSGRSLCTVNLQRRAQSLEQNKEMTEAHDELQKVFIQDV